MTSRQTTKTGRQAGTSHLPVDSLATLERVAEAVWHGPQDVLDVSHNVPLGRAMYCLRWGDFEATHEDRVRVIADLKARLSLLA